jgi:single-stranded-DNA-specific exonuclease
MQISSRKRWQIAQQIPPGIEAKLIQFPAILRQLLYNRGISGPEEAELYLSAGGSLFDPFRLKDMEKTVERLMRAVNTGEPIAVYGDYDVDGVTATALMVQVLSRLGAQVSPYIPDRFEEGYGVNNGALESLHQQGVRVILTVDCGIRSPAEADFARSLGVDLIICDHHEPQGRLPEAFAIICPKQQGDLYPEKNLAGVGLAYKIAEALLTVVPQTGLVAEDFLDLVAIGTVADVVPLTGENRSLVKAGLVKLRNTQRQGLVSLAAVSGLELSRVNARDIGFVIAPRLNAAGRLESALEAYKLLMTEDTQEAARLAQQLDDQNRQRQEKMHQMQSQAESLFQFEEPRHLLHAVYTDFRQVGVIGLVASRLTEQFYRPAVVVTKENEFTRGSCRSIPEFHITHALDECADLLVRHGGHSMAAGFTVRTENLPKLVERLTFIADRELEGRDVRPVLKADMEINFADLHPRILNDIDAIEPTGLENPGVLFVSRNVRVLRSKRVGGEQQHLRLTLSSDSIVFDAIAFRLGFWDGQLPDRIDILYSFERNHYSGRDSLQLNVRDLKPANQPD